MAPHPVGAGQVWVWSGHGWSSGEPGEGFFVSTRVSDVGGFDLSPLRLADIPGQSEPWKPFEEGWCRPQQGLLTSGW